ncbi:MAG: sensor histidine kinase [Dehalococcoidia bacterium]
MAVPARVPASSEQRRRFRAHPALAVALAYLAAGALWIVGSEWLLRLLVPDDRTQLGQLLKGVGFVAVTSLALYLVLSRMMGELQEGARAQESLASRLRLRSAQQRRLSQRLMQAEEDTRRAVAKDLHDGPLQALTLSFMRLDAATRSGAADTVDAEQVISAMSAIRDASDEIRAVVRALHPPLLAELGLAPAIERHCHETSTRTGRDIRFARDIDATVSAGHDVAIAAFRITQEAVANAVKHTTADPIVVTLVMKPERIDVDIVDGGPGFNPEVAIGAGLGLLSMRERAESVGGELAVTSNASGGTHVSARIPIEEAVAV